MSLFHSYVRIAAAGLLVHAGIAVAQTGTWTAPSSGYIFDPVNSSVRALTGFVGSAVLGQPVANGIGWASVAPDQKSALTMQDGSLVWIPDLSVAATSQTLDRIPLPQQAFWAADSSQAAILAAGSQVIWLTSFSSTPVPLSSWNLEPYSRVSSRVSSTETSRALIRMPARKIVWSVLAADSAANQVLLSLDTGEGWQIWFASSTVPPINIPFSGRPVAAAFVPGSGGVFVADAAGHRIVQIQNLQTNPVSTTVVSSEVNVNEPTALAVSSDGNRLFVADGADSMIRVFDVSSSAAGGGTPMAEVPAGTTPVSLTMFTRDRFLLNAFGVAGQRAGQRAGQPLYFLDTGVPARVSFVPREQ